MKGKKIQQNIWISIPDTNTLKIKIKMRYTMVSEKVKHVAGKLPNVQVENLCIKTSFKTSGNIHSSEVNWCCVGYPILYSTNYMVQIVWNYHPYSCDIVIRGFLIVTWYPPSDNAEHNAEHKLITKKKVTR